MDYKSTEIKQYHKDRRCSPRPPSTTMDFGIGKRLNNLPALRKIGFQANRRLLDVQRLSHDPIIGVQRLCRSACDPVIHDNGTRIAGLRLTDPRAQALLHILLIFRLHPRGFLNRDLRHYSASPRPPPLAASHYPRSGHLRSAAPA